jgi:NAD(P)-dependent dehydrogenase (short-subunit alcohol dehydrogenase family)
MSDLSGRTTVVVGASRDLERGIARAFAEAGGGQLGRVPGRRFSSWSPATPL